jgi:hypothetical protein
VQKSPTDSAPFVPGGTVLSVVRRMGGYPGLDPTSRPRVLSVVVNFTEGRPGVGTGAVHGGESVSVSVMSIRLRISSGADLEGSGSVSCCNALRRCNRRAVDDWAGEVTGAAFEGARWA